VVALRDKPPHGHPVVGYGSETIAAIVDQVIGSVHLILYVTDQVAATAFWKAVLDCPPTLDVLGMTEFALGTGGSA